MYRNLAGCILIAVLLGVYFLYQQEDAARGEDTFRLSLTDLLSESEEGFARALTVRNFLFPEDHGPHPGFKTEWWYFTGNLEAPSGRSFGFQFTLFRSALAAAPVKRKSAWGTDQAYMAHLALTDVEGEEFFAFERFSRGAMELAGAAAEPLRFWLEDWCVEEAGPGQFPGLPVMRLRAFEEDIGVELRLESLKPVVLQGDRGLSRKGLNPGNSSYYYSLTRLQAEGKIVLSGEEWDVKGLAWLDREWSTSVLEKEQVGWDWFALHLDNGAEFMFYRMRRADSAADKFSSGCWIETGGRTSFLGAAAVRIENLDFWKNRDGDSYPSRWKISIPERDTILEIKPLVADQELRLSIHYWEGSVSIEGTVAGRPTRGKGYVELTGYADKSIWR